MNTRLYVGNLAFQTTEDGVRSAFTQFGDVTEVKLVLDRDSGQSRGFAFVTMGSADAARKAMEQMNGTLLDGRPLRVNEAEAKPERSFGGGGGSRGGGGGRGGGRRERW